MANIDYAVNRSYASGQGRFTSVDPIGMGAASLGNPQSLNLYAYVQNNPIDYTDPSGLDIPEDEGPPIIIDSPDWWRDLYQLWLHSQERVLIQPMISNLGHESGGGGSDDKSLPKDLKDKVVAIANGCKDFINRFLTELGGKNVQSTDFKQLYERIGKISIDATKFAVNSPQLGISKKENNFGAAREIYINPSKIEPVVPGKQEISRDNHIIGVVFQELFHHAKKEGLFRDEQLDATVLKFYDKTGEKAQKEKYMSRTGYLPGTIGHGLINANCLAKTRND